ncbi:hypothetical protein CO115_04990 [Candidatus Falkowbacteria bacterium CG_4_9_14_3_um_filter_36_9]|uniref:Uncharacterized protein n=2 Tax=Candidatus Falkowiibacteriota TaxID=1752728 RepID=A0A1J4T4N3_9BACT|nr:MAG: hypothetical protein AUJ27_03590 [Candidatus Falkowbacteria bacterium CG1_02_37_44]PIV50704.1 MAG: hypothetical protein COS18_04220 [Candidatus Falkowbacteria bacterium CG02_land_8_20_14_3_00_36_14]PIX11324.1 MAG: hypothetical protein COZ73_02925 [Candidatus Falkowbacteria bacterium CG_4_8_14_3_um_filter_36_11]PJA10496.1 MAG: hypothetical protein COX67_04440 [Candidatus Falkowbacteria bacterium CG_4_10_14_0_2_um_filter_36_22]PJB18160.1 MAG: hypothetical protein CO115_04990 [Candidatus F
MEEKISLIKITEKNPIRIIVRAGKFIITFIDDEKGGIREEKSILSIKGKEREANPSIDTFLKAYYFALKKFNST